MLGLIGAVGQCTARSVFLVAAMMCCRDAVAAESTARVDRPFIALDGCFPGLLDAQNVTPTGSANVATQAWLRAARNVAPHCFTEKKRTDDVFGNVVSHAHRFVYQINAKVLSIVAYSASVQRTLSWYTDAPLLRTAFTYRQGRTH